MRIDQGDVATTIATVKALTLTGGTLNSQALFLDHAEEFIWFNGRESPTEIIADQWEALQVRYVGAVSADKVRGLFLEFWGM